MDFHKIKQYSIFQLLKIFYFKVGYKISLIIEATRIKIIGSNHTKFRLNYENIEISSFSEFYVRCNNKNKNNLLKETDEILNGIITVFDIKVKFDPEKDWLKDPKGNGCWNKYSFFSNSKTIENGLNDVKYVLEVNKLNHLVRVALAYHYTNEMKYLEYIDRSIKGFIRCVPYERSVVNRIIMDQAFRVINLIQLSLLCWNSAYFKKNIYPKINILLLGYERQMRRFNTPRWFKTGNGVNHNIGEMTGLIICQLWLSQFENKPFEKSIIREFSYLHEVLNRMISPSGVYLEQSANYSRLVLEFLTIFEIFVNELYSNSEIKNLYFSKKYKNRLESYMSDLIHDGLFPNFGDNDDARVLWAFMNYKSDCSYLNLVENSFSVLPSSCPTKYLDGSQWVYKSHDSNNIWMFLRVGQFSYCKEGASSHVHNDLLALLLSINGVDVFIDRGTSFYNTGKTIRDLDIKTASHNTVSIETKEMAEIRKHGLVNFPVSQIIPNSNCLFSGFVKYENITHTRNIEYKPNEIYIIDIVDYKRNERESNGSIYFLISEYFKIVKISENKVQLVCKEKEMLLEIEFKGCDKIKSCTTDYYPSYGSKRETLSIRCYFNFIDYIELTTKISIIPQDLKL